MRKLFAFFCGCVFAFSVYAQTPNKNILRLNGVVHPAASTDFTLGVLPPSLYIYSSTSLRTITNAAGVITSSPNNLLLNSASLSTQGVAVLAQWNYIVACYGSGSIAFSGSATGTLACGGASQASTKLTAPTAGTLTLTVTGTVSNATLSAVTSETTPRPGDQVVTTSAAYYGPAFDYDPVTHAPIGISIWGGRTNFYLNNGSPATQTIAVANATNYTFSFYGSGTFTLSGACSTVLTGSAYPARTSYTCMTSGTSVVLTLTTPGTITYPQFETGTYSTSVILTGATTAARATESLYFAGAMAACFSGGRGSAVLKVNYAPSAFSQMLLVANSIQMLGKNVSNFASTGLGSTLTSLVASTWTSPNDLGLSWGPSLGVLDINGVKVSDAVTRAPAAPFAIGGGRFSYLACYGSQIANPQ